MLNFDDDVNSVEDFLADLEEEPELTDKKHRFKERVNDLMKRHNLIRSDAEEVVETVIRTKETTKRCTCGEVAQFFDPQDKRKIYCGECWPKRSFPNVPPTSNVRNSGAVGYVDCGTK